MKNKLFTACFLGFIIVMPSCKKYLDAKSNSQLTTPTSIVALQALLDNGQYINSKSPSFGEASADDYYMPQSKYDTRPPLTQQAYVWNTANLSYYTFSESHDWANLYFVVYNANICLEEIEKIERNTQNAASWDNIKGSALFLRARSFLQLAWIFSKAYDSATASQDLGIPLRLGSDFNVPSVRSDVKETYDRIISDLKESVHLLPDLPERVLRPSKAASYAYLARTYLSMRNYDSAYKYADLSLRLKSDLMDYNDNSVVNVDASHPFIQFNKEVVYYQFDNTFSFSSILQKNSRIDSNLINSYFSDDLRRSAYFIPNPDGYLFKGSYSGSSLFTGIATDELYLNRAECAVRLGNVSSGINDLNKLLETRWKTGTFIGDSILNANEVLNKILLERRKELLFRDLRWIDIKRLNKENRNIPITRFINNKTYTLPPNDNRFALALPTDIVNLSGMPQNPQ